MRLKPYFVKPAKTFFYWGWTIPKEHYDDLKKFFDLNRRVKKSTEIVIKFKNKKYSAKINYTRINNTRKYKRERLYPERDVLRIQYDNEYDLITCLDFLFGDIRSLFKNYRAYVNGFLDRRQPGQMRQ